MPKDVKLDPEYDDRTRAKIQTSQIINQLNKLVKGEVEMTSQQVRAAEILLRKSLPDLQTAEYNNHTEHQAVVIINDDIPRKTI